MFQIIKQNLFGVKRNLIPALLLAALVLGGTATPLLASAPDASTCKLQSCLDETSKNVTIKLVGVKSYELTLLFQHLLQNLDGVSTVEPAIFTLNPRRPQSCYAEWQVTIDDTSLFAFESRLYNRLKEVAANPDGQTFPGFTLDVTASELSDLGHISPQHANTRTLTFVQTLAFAENHCTPTAGTAPYSDGPLFGNHGFE